MNITLRPARPADAEEMTRWFTDLVNLAEWGGPEVRFPLTNDQLAAWIAEGANERPRVCYSATDEHDRPIGHVEFLRDPPKRWARLGRFGIAPSLRGKGFGRALFDHSVKFAFTDLDVEQLDLAVVPENTRARGMYLRSGFRDAGAVPGSWTVAGKPYVMNTMTLMRADWRRTAGADAVASRVA
jgi:RimJ/RimL family protein N-acetyltransferase